MTKQELKANNDLIEEKYEQAVFEYDDALTKTGYIASKRLRTCSAEVIETNNYYFLVSYRTMVAFIDKATDTCYDVLRLVYGYTSTSAQHIAKFRHDYGAGKWGCEHEMRWCDK